MQRLLGEGGITGASQMGAQGIHSVRRYPQFAPLTNFESSEQGVEDLLVEAHDSIL